MIATLLRISRTSLRRDRVAQMMVFILPIVFFSIFAMVFGRQSMSNMARIRIAVVDEDRSEASRQLIEALRADPGLRVRDSMAAGSGAGPSGAAGRGSPGAAKMAGPRPLDRRGVEAMVRAGDVPVALVLPAGWGLTFPDFGGRGLRAEMLADPSDPVARHLVVGLVQRAAARIVQAALGGTAASAAPVLQDAGMLVPTRITDVLGDRRRSGQMISFYAAGIAVMFLLFSCSSAGGVMLDEQDSGTLERVLNTRVGMSGLLAAKWLHITLLGITQVSVMFVYGMLAFHLDLLSHLPGFAVMTVVTAGAAAGFGLVLATLCRTRQQLGGIATILILSMSALGGSMFPRFLMSEGMQKVGLATFNAWALDGYIKVFWRDARLVELWPQVAVLAGLTVVFLTVARMLARRWETV